jgi:hypothetical protein
MVLTVIIVIVMLVIAGGLVALYREVTVGSAAAEINRMAPGPGTAAKGRDAPGSDAPPAAFQWPFGNLTVGNHVAVPSPDPFTGFLAVCADDTDALGELHSTAVVAEDWGYPLLVAITKTPQPNGWTDRLDSLPGTVGHYDMRVDEMRSLKPARLPVVAFLNESRLLDASTTLDSPSSIATSFQHCRFGLTR